jgi:hypothetical protein
MVIYSFSCLGVVAPRSAAQHKREFPRSQSPDFGTSEELPAMVCFGTETGIEKGRGTLAPRPTQSTEMA